jgi:hypothetical protein
MHLHLPPDEGLGKDAESLLARVSYNAILLLEYIDPVLWLQGRAIVAATLEKPLR